MTSALTEGWNPALQHAAEREGASDVEAAGQEIARLIEATLRGEGAGGGEEHSV
jgi:hypothetical protein